jgi:pyrroloquinoline quinone biosynthesis protein E
LLAELTYACPLQCPYCSNPVDFGARRTELDTQDWLRVFSQARALGAVQLGFSGGEPLTRPDLDTLVAEARKLGFYTNLITSAVGLDARRIARFRELGLDHIQISFQGGDAITNDEFAGTKAFDHKLAMAREVKAQGFPMVLNFVLHRQNIDSMGTILDLAVSLEADQVELANTQYYGWAFLNRSRLLPTRDQLRRAEAVAHEYQRRHQSRMKILYVVPDYYEERPKACMNGWGRTFLSIAPDGTALPCQAAAQLPGIVFPNVREDDVESIWVRSDAFNKYRGEQWMKAPCRDCPERARDFGGCRCQAYLLTGDARNADPVCSLSPHHGTILDTLDSVQQSPAVTTPLVYRNPRNSKRLSAGD